MHRTLTIDIDRSTWPGPGIPPLFPRAFTSGSSSYNLDIKKMLLMIGYLTTPTSSTGVSLSEFWAWVRYFAAISPEPHLSLTRAFSELDSHQKTILSDDFGMGVPLLWLSETLQLDPIVDGQYFMKRVSASVGATQKRSAKRGPNKTPDFVARDSSGKWHVIECKGTQSGIIYSDTQLGSKGPPPSGGVAQKLSIEFPPHYTGQRLACGLRIDVEGKSGAVLKVVDPKPVEPFKFGPNELRIADDAAYRGVMARVLRMSGYEITAEGVASPLGEKPDDVRRKSNFAENARKRIVDGRSERSRAEMRDATRHNTLFNKKFLGRETVFQLPRAIYTNDRRVQKVILRQGINQDALRLLEERPAVEDLVDADHAPWIKLLGRSEMSADEMSAKMQIGDVFQSEIILE